MFEKSLYDLIRGLRNHKGNEKEYIQESLRECRKEIKSNDMDLKATALLKLIYLEMFGHDMSWASFNVLEVMSSQKYIQKRVGYLGAIQSFRPDTEVLMLAENLLKKDLNSPHPTTISLALTAVPHVISPSMAISLLSDLLPRMSHSYPAIRKKTIVTLYRLALVYPETLRPAWPKIKERLLDENEDPSVTAAIINVVCELGWRRPQDFLPLAPRLFDLLVQGGNNWMAIKIIKLFAVLTPLEPRLVKKLLPPLTSIIKTTPAMSLLYECINGIIQGGILETSGGSVEGEEIARLCVGKLRGMLVVEGDPNLKYVALLAFNKIVTSHPHLVSLHQDVILECIDDPDISIRMRALDLVVGMVNSDNLNVIVDRLMRQLRNAPAADKTDDPANDRGVQDGIIPMADDEDEDAGESLRRNERRSDQPPPLPEDYRISVIKRILEMCSRDTYANINDFEWYIDILVQLVKCSPATTALDAGAAHSVAEEAFSAEPDVSSDIGHELQNVAVRVKGLRSEVTNAAQSLLLVERREDLFPASGTGARAVLEYAAWVIGEYAEYVSDPHGVMDSLLHSSTTQLPHRVLAVYLQAIPKVFSAMAGSSSTPWTPERKTMVTLLVARIIHFLEPLTTHPNLEVQERAVEYLELMRLALEAASTQSTESDTGYAEPPLIITQAIPTLFMGMELNPVAKAAQKKVPLPDDLDLNNPINDQLQALLQQADYDDQGEPSVDDFHDYYNKRPGIIPTVIPAADRLEEPKEPTSYQQVDETLLDPDIIARRRAEHRERHKDDPFYIANEDSGRSTPMHNILKTSNGEDLDIDAIPIMDLDLSGNSRPDSRDTSAAPSRKRKPQKAFDILVDETIGADDTTTPDANRPELRRAEPTKPKKSLLQVDSSGLGTLSLEGDGSNPLDVERREAEEAEMAKAMKEIERLRLEMQRASERIHAPEATVVKRKKKKPKPAEGMEAPEQQPETEVKKKKKKKPKIAAETAKETAETDAAGKEAVVKPKKKKKRQITFEEGPAAESYP